MIGYENIYDILTRITELVVLCLMYTGSHCNVIATQSMSRGRHLLLTLASMCGANISLAHFSV